MATSCGGVGPPPNDTAGQVGTKAGGGTVKRYSNHLDRLCSRSDLCVQEHREIDIYDPRCRIGHVIEHDHGRRCEAYDVAGNAIGVFAAPIKAARAVWMAHVERRGAA